MYYDYTTYIEYNNTVIRLRFRFDPLLYDGCSRSNETGPGRVPTGQACALSVRTVPGGFEMLGC